MTVEAYYETYWTTDGHCPRGFMYPDLERLLEKLVPQGARCLDVGCGDGRTAGLWLREHGRDYVGVDISETAIEHARGLGLDARVIDDAAALPFPDQSIDAVLCIEVLEHLFAPHDAAGEALRVLKPGGVLIATAPNTAYWRRRLELALAGRWNPVGDDLSVAQPWRDPHIRFFTVSALRRMLSSVGFGSIEIRGHAGSLARDIPWLGVRYWRGRKSPLYERAERALPSLFGLRLNATAIKPPLNRSGGRRLQGSRRRRNGP